jgi:type II secretory pathway component PulJ
MKHITKRFTMLELIVSMSALTIIMIIMMEFFSSAQKAWVASSEQADVYDNARMALDLITSDLNSINYNDSSDVNFYHSLGTTTKPEILGFMMHFESKLNKIIYTINNDKNSNKYRFLTRCKDEKGDYDTKPKGSESTVFAASEDKFYRIIPNVCKLEFICYDKELNKLDHVSDFWKFPWYVQIKLTLMGTRSFVKWEAFKGTSKANDLLDSYGVTINKLVYLGSRGQDEK